MLAGRHPLHIADHQADHTPDSSGNEQPEDPLHALAQTIDLLARQAQQQHGQQHRGLEDGQQIEERVQGPVAIIPETDRRPQHGQHAQMHQQQRAREDARAAELGDDRRRRPLALAPCLGALSRIGRAACGGLVLIICSDIAIPAPRLRAGA